MIQILYILACILVNRLWCKNIIEIISHYYDKASNHNKSNESSQFLIQ
jgi:hypothetical protein